MRPRRRVATDPPSGKEPSAADGIKGPPGVVGGTSGRVPIAQDRHQWSGVRHSGPGIGSAYDCWGGHAWGGPLFTDDTGPAVRRGTVGVSRPTRCSSLRGSVSNHSAGGPSPGRCTHAIARSAGLALVEPVFLESCAINIVNAPRCRPSPPVTQASHEAVPPEGSYGLTAADVGPRGWKN
jgi:hypothetical protein